MKRAFANFPVNREVYDKSIEILEQGIRQAKITNMEKFEAFKSLKEFLEL